LVKKDISFHNGTINVESQGLGKGTTFIVRLPICFDLANFKEDFSQIDMLESKLHSLGNALVVPMASLYKLSDNIYLSSKQQQIIERAIWKIKEAEGCRKKSAKF